MSRHIHHDGVILLVWSNEIVWAFTPHFTEVSSICRMPEEYCLFWQQSKQGNASSQSSAKERKKKSIYSKIIPCTMFHLYFLYIVSTSLRYKFNTVGIWYRKYDWCVRQTACHSRIQTYPPFGLVQHLPFQSKLRVVMKVGYSERKGCLPVPLRLRVSPWSSEPNITTVLLALRCSRAELNWYWVLRAAQWSPVRHKPAALQQSSCQSFTPTARVKARSSGELSRLFVFLKDYHAIL